MIKKHDWRRSELYPFEMDVYTNDDWALECSLIGVLAITLVVFAVEYGGVLDLIVAL